MVGRFWSRYECVFFLIVLLTYFHLQVARADENIFDILDEQYIEDIKDLPFSSGTPTINWHQSGNIKGWIDITGFRNLSREGENYFIIGDPASLAIVAADAAGTPQGIFDSIDKTVSFSQSGNILTASLNVILKWHTIYCDKKGCYINGRFTDMAVFSDSEIVPDQVSMNFNSISNIIEYNNTLNPRTELKTAVENTSTVTYNYNGEIMINRLKVAHVEQTNKGVYFANLTDMNIWIGDTPSMSRFGNTVVIKNTTRPDYTKLSIYASNIYGSQEVNSAHAERETYTFRGSFSKLFLALLYFTVVCATVIIFCIRGKL